MKLDDTASGKVIRLKKKKKEMLQHTLRNAKSRLSLIAVIKLSVYRDR